MKTFLYDGTFEGFLSTIFDIYFLKYFDAEIAKKALYKNNFFSEEIIVETNAIKAKRVLEKLDILIGKEGIRILLYSLLSEIECVENTMLKVVQYALTTNQNVMLDFAHKSVLQLVNITKSVGREKHRMEAFVRFELLKDGVYFAKIEPDFDVLMLIMKNFSDRYQDQKWIIYDVKRNYGIFYNLEKVEVIYFDTKFDYKRNIDILSNSEMKYQDLWKEYFNHTNIKERKNIQLHTKHVPKRYWKYLSEKNNGKL